MGRARINTSSQDTTIHDDGSEDDDEPCVTDGTDT